MTTDPPHTSRLQRVVLKGVSKRFGRQLAVARVSLTVRQGRTCVIMGDNGAGKSTLLGIMAGILLPDEGAIRYETAAQALDGPALRRRLGIVSHKPMIYPELSALENVVFFARIGGLKDATAAARAELERLGLDPDSPKPAAQFSRGMLARLTAARALVTGPELVLLDEAASGLDRHGRRALVEALKDLAPERVVVLTTHHVDTAAQLAQHLVLLSRGHLRREVVFDGEDVAARQERIEGLLTDPDAAG